MRMIGIRCNCVLSMTMLLVNHGDFYTTTTTTRSLSIKVLQHHSQRVFLVYSNFVASLQRFVTETKNNFTEFLKSLAARSVVPRTAADSQGTFTF